MQWLKTLVAKVKIGLQKVERGITRATRKFRRDKIQVRIDELRKIINDARICEAAMLTPFWKEVLNPWLDENRESNKYDLDNCRRHYPDDGPLHYERGKIHVITQLKAFLKETINQKTLAEQELEVLVRSQQEESHE